ncbi:MAG: hypothetical protein NZM42_09170 [Gemmatales bacterium]|nr:hypothetical protein [Gemmatales bacterium]
MPLLPRSVLATVLLLSLHLSALGEVGAPREVAPQAPSARHQVWASLAWSEQAKCWLVAWREGYLNEQAADIWCARIAEDGTPLDAKGIRLSEGGLNNRPRVASDGKNFLVVWERYRPISGSENAAASDWDVVARRVSGSAVPEAKTFVVADGPHNQCRPDVVFSKGYYFVAWMAYARGLYGVHGIRYTPDGERADMTPIVVSRHEPKDATRPGPMINALLPVLAVEPQGQVVATFFQSILNARDHPGYHRHLAFRVLDPVTGQPTTPLPPIRPNDKLVAGLTGHPYDPLAPALAYGSKTGVLISRAVGRKPQRVLSLSLVSPTGEVTSVQDFGSPLITSQEFYPLQMRPGVAHNGKEFVVVSDCLSDVPAQKPDTRPPQRFVRILGWKLTDEGTFQDQGFVLAGTPERQCLLPAVASGPPGVCLLVYSEVRGMDDTKLVCRLVK